MSYGCHPATGGACDCDWDTNEQGYDYFVQCDECADLWEKQPCAKWGYNEELPLAPVRGGCHRPGRGARTPPRAANARAAPRASALIAAVATRTHGCHPATGGACDCDWETDDHGHDHFAQCDTCAELWEKEPEAEWPYDKIALREDSWAVLSLLDVADSLPEGSDRRKALGVAVAKALELDLLNRSDGIRRLFADWLPQLMRDEVVMADMGDVLRSCAEELACS